MEDYREQIRMNANQIRTMNDDEVLIVSGNQDPIKDTEQGVLPSGMEEAGYRQREIPCGESGGGDREESGVGGVVER